MMISNRQTVSILTLLALVFAAYGGRAIYVALENTEFSELSQLAYVPVYLGFFFGMLSLISKYFILSFEIKIHKLNPVPVNVGGSNTLTAKTKAKYPYSFKHKGILIMHNNCEYFVKDEAFNSSTDAKAYAEELA